MIFSPRNPHVRSVRILLVLAVFIFAVTFFTLGQVASLITPYLPHWWESVVLLTLAVAWVVESTYQTRKRLPQGISVIGSTYQIPASSVTFLRDLTYTSATGQHTHDQQIFAEVLQMIQNAQSFILIDMFLFNGFPGRTHHVFRPIARQITEALIAQKQRYPQLAITVITDPINTVYGEYLSPEFKQLDEQRIQVITTDLRPLRDSNPLYSGLWRSVLQWLAPFQFLPLLPHPFNYDLPPVPLSSYLTAFNAKGNHRKIIVADSLDTTGSTKVVSLITSANFHDGSTAHSNVALKITDRLYKDVILSEEAVAQLSGEVLKLPTPDVTDQSGPVAVQMLTEGKIRKAILHLLRHAQSGAHVDIVMFALSERTIIRALLRASRRGVNIRLILDPNREAFGYSKTGLPNQPVAWELLKRSSHQIQIRWYATHEEQCHSKFLLHRSGQQATTIIGSANYTRRNLRDYNLEMSIQVTGGPTVPALADATQYFEMIWTNQGGNIYTTDYASQAKTNIFKFARYWIQEVSGVSAN